MAMANYVISTDNCLTQFNIALQYNYMPRSIYQLKKLEELKKKATTLYKEGLSVREIAPIVGKSHGWVWLAVKEKLSTRKHLTKLDNQLKLK
jgi:transposase-like protein